MRDVCGACGSGDLAEILDLGETPAANTLAATARELVQFYPLKLGVCRRCWLVQQLCLVPDDVLYNDSYAFYSAASLPKVRYHAALAQRLYAKHREQARQLTVEVGCNDGDLLRHFSDVGCRVLGVDPSGGPAKQAATRGLPVMIEPFTAAVAERIVTEHGKAGLVIAQHVLAHVTDLNDFMDGVRRLLSPDGVAVIEVQYLPDLIVGNQLDHVYHEHRYHFSVTTLAKLALAHGLGVTDVRHTPEQSGSISVTLSQHSWPVQTYQEGWLCQDGAYSSLQGRAEHIRARLRDILVDERASGQRVAGYGAPAKATTLLHFCGIDSDLVSYVVDTTPAKAGKYLPGTGIEIVRRDWDGVAASLYTQTRPAGREMPDIWLCLVWNYLSDVLRREWEFTGNGGRWLVPVPVPVLL